jgi:CheY-like chemotaxis protein
MSAIVIDTNVLLVANGLAPQMSEGCRLVCLARLEEARSSDAIVIDLQYLILGEYQRKLDPNRRPPGPGDTFLRHVLQNMGTIRHVTTVSLTATNADQTDFQEFPDDEYLRKAFDPADRKFVAASNAHLDKPPIVESADSKWLEWEERLSTHGIHLEVLCRSELEAFRAKKSKQK